jgi:two-component system, LytTR family, response regulator
MKPPIRCAIVDDDAIAAQILRHHIAKDPRLELTGVYEHPHEALLAFQTLMPELVFLDIHMPDVSGLELFRAFQPPPVAIFTTVSRKHAVQAFDLHAADYLVKPYTFERFLQAVTRAIVLIEAQSKGAASLSEPDSFWVKSEGKLLKLSLHDILYAEAQENYVCIVTAKESLMVAMPLKAVEEMLPAARFCRIHRSFIVSLLHASIIDGNTIHVGSAIVPIGRSYRDALLERIGGSLGA